jgi:hypothetical protein
MSTNTKIIITAVDKTKSAMSGVKNNIDAARKSVDKTVKSLAGLAAIGVAGLTAIYAQTAKSADQLGKFSDQVGEAPEKIQGLRRAAELTNVSTEILDKSLEKMTKNLGEATRGTGEASKWLKEMGLNTQAFFSQSPADQFAAIGSKVNAMSTQQEKAAASSALFGRSGLALVNTLNLGEKGLADIQQEVKDYGLALTRIDIAKIEAANDSWFRASEVTQGFGNQLTTQLAPIVAAVANEFLNSAKEAGGLGSVADNVVNFMVKAVGFAADTVRGLGLAWNGVKLVVAGVVSVIVQGMVKADEAVTSFLNMLPGVTAKTSEGLSNLSEAFKSTYDDINKDLQDSLLTPMPSEKIERFVSDVQSKATEAAKKVAAASQENIGSTLLIPLSVGITDETNEKILEDLNAIKTTSEEVTTAIDETFSNAFNNISSNIGSTMSRAIVEGNSLKDAFASVGKALVVDMLGGLIKIGAQMAINAVMAKIFQTETAVTAGITGTAVAASWAPAAALASLASFGSNAGPAAAGITSTVGLASTLALTGMAHDGIDNVPKEGTWLLDKGERVLSSGQNDEIVKAVKSGTGGTGGGASSQNYYTINNNFYGDVYGDDDALAEKVRDKVDEGFRLINPDSINGRELAA